MTPALASRAPTGPVGFRRSVHEMIRPNQVAVPTVVRVKAGALDRLGVYLERAGRRRVAVLVSAGLQAPLPERAARSLAGNSIEAAAWTEVTEHDVESAARLFVDLPSEISAVVGIGGGKALDVAKYVAFLGGLPYFAVPTSLSNDGFASSQSSLTVRGKRRSLTAASPYGVVVDTAVCLEAPRMLSLAGIGDVAAKLTAARDWKLAFHAVGEPIDDFALLLSESSVHALLSRPRFDLEGIRLLATALLFDGIAMQLCGSSRPASGSEHLISHALDAISERPRLHGLQVGVAAYLVSLLQGSETERIGALFDATGFWDAVAGDPFSRAEWLEAVRLAPTIKQNFYTVLSSRDVSPEVERLLTGDERLRRCFCD
jgi:glycerol-1-phosphate dehydrogenase [NAD(P)+]